ncbi:hypothetical protein D7M10_05035 [Pseudomonas fluorescens]|jgi:hypothetical protein|uniref:DUF7683 domain-containing protein n=1 Tax=Pseudomonas TaxID=286 RepID=UPI000EAACD7C|nr:MULTISPECIES: hypothetical protein [Pseudomonas]AYG06480.1 hypothetical protein D7M10_05035 [Pseudomonas fluorescens]MDZ4300770.1 hypothetical protein [Pseudomonas sp.]MBJ2241812.1 hypothetical protein [Pseudomonas sp. MF6768]MBJ2252294.1 hypothetical protein [Pseudomonas sp. MF6784]MBJ2265029.1 hypothetical protein [Pseudomonas sp. MF6787]
MKHLIYVVPVGSDDVSIEIPLRLQAKDLLPIMGWKTENECIYDYLLTHQQIDEIEKLTSQSFPRNASIYLACDD